MKKNLLLMALVSLLAAAAFSCINNDADEDGATGAKTLTFFQLDDPVLIQIRDELKNIDINTLSPLDAFDKLREIKKVVSYKP